MSLVGRLSSFFSWKKGIEVAIRRDVPFKYRGKDFDTFWKDYKFSGIPRYILIDGEGKIVNANADRPSSGKVGSRIRSLLNSGTQN